MKSFICNLIFIYYKKENGCGAVKYGWGQNIALGQILLKKCYFKTFKTKVKITQKKC